MKGFPQQNNPTEDVATQSARSAKNNPAGALRQVQRGAISISSFGYFVVQVKVCSGAFLERGLPRQPKLLAHNRFGNSFAGGNVRSTHDNASVK
jgi:hypothetical protein